ncbi:septal ring lytic transglycosylase RlpA family protein [Neptunitalea lumnitzerae]|uniref:Probable endolytic peptidoglycan transglycosylase RlpA n=1 Tax=Neptunitalea lumnitzerae TaxID=2965509 RepID=A0ABQ5MLU0_9FLAO|nr:septal ring lytic transglycosylase RlpA family protein [Neptunitalea sp. Y10]GLB50385.1 hypothetical protein Y10_27530 [Neptunitalea sp. Y10]
MRNFILLLLILCAQIGIAQSETGKASFYAKKFNGRTTASGEIYHHILPTAAHRTLPFGTKVRVTNLVNDRWAIVTINDRGPFVKGRIIDVSRSVAEKLDFINAGVTDVRIEIVSGDGDVAQEVTNTEVVTTSTTTTSTGGVTTETVTVTSGAAEVIMEPEFYELDIEKVRPDWMGIQIGSFRELANLIKLADSLKNKFKREVTVQVKSVNGVKVYALIIGKFPERDKAERFMEKVEEDYPDCFIVDMTK